MQSASSSLEIILFIIVFGVLLLVLVPMALRADTETERQETERERIKYLSKCLGEGRLLIKRQDQNGAYQDISFDPLELGDEEPEVKRLPEGKHRQVRWQPRNRQKTWTELEVYRGNYPSKARKFYREEDE